MMSEAEIYDLNHDGAREAAWALLEVENAHDMSKDKAFSYLNAASDRIFAAEEYGGENFVQLKVWANELWKRFYPTWDPCFAV